MWSPQCSQEVKAAKQLLITSNVLTHYDLTLLLKLAADASQYGIEAVISHIISDGEERPVAFASNLLFKSDKEALALVLVSRSSIPTSMVRDSPWSQTTNR